MESEWGGDRRRVIGVCFRDRRQRRRGTCGASGVLGPAPGVMGTFQAIEAIKTLSGVGESMRGKLMMFDALSARPTRTLEVRDEPDPACERCGAARISATSRRTITTRFYPPRRVPRVPRRRRVYGRVVSISPPLPRTDRATRSTTTSRGVGVVSRLGERLRDDARFRTRARRGRASGARVRRRASPGLRLGTHRPIGRTRVARHRRRSRERGDADDIVHFICAGGVNSQRAAEWFSTLPDVVRRGRRARDVRGGFASWRRDVDPTFPKLD